MSDFVDGLPTYTRSASGKTKLVVLNHGIHSKERSLPVDVTMFKDAIDRRALARLIPQGTILVKEHPATREATRETATLVVDSGPQGLLSATENNESILRSSWDLFSLFAHQLLTYMTYIELTVDTMVPAERSAAQTETPEEDLEFIRDQVYHAADILKRGMNLMRILREGSLQLEPVALSPLIRSTVNRFKTQYGHRNISLTLAVDGIILGSQLLTELIIENLVQNALVHSGAHSAITITVEEQGEMILVSVMDNGRGISTEQLQRLFTPSEQISLSSTKKRSRGLGLFLTKMAVEMQGGQIWVESGNCQGTRFHFTLKKCPVFEVEAEGEND
jgi:signal transduction histidine kinase